MTGHLEEGVLLALVVALTLVPRLRGDRDRRRRALGLVLLTAFSSGLAWGSLKLPLPRGPLPPPADQRPLELPLDGYVTSSECKACHPGPHASWRASYHSTMTQVAMPGAVAGDFDAGALTFLGKTYRVERRGSEFWVGIPPEQGADLQWHRVVQTTGSHSMQVYWYSSGEGRTLDQFPLVFLLQEQRWIPRNSAFLRPPPVQQHPPSEKARWNRTCVLCHTTDPRSRILGEGPADTVVSEFGISCEACHGPGAEHVRVNRDPARRYLRYLEGDGDPTIVNPARLPHDRATQVCGQCHSVFYSKSQRDYERQAVEGFRYRPGDRLEDTRHIVRFAADPAEASPLDRQLTEFFPGYMQSRFWSDGMIRVGGREYNSLLENPCYQRGELSCLSCHALHQPEDDPREPRAWADDLLRLDAQGNQACVACHEDLGGAIEAHTFHARDSAGSECMNCHMPHTSYALQKAIRSHTIDSPRVDSELQTGRPNACNLCHLDRSLAWTAERLQAWYGQEPPALSADQEQVPAGVRWLLSGDAGVRALTAWSMGWEPAQEAAGRAWLPGYLAETLTDPYDAVRFIGARSLASLPGFADFDYEPLASPDARGAARLEALRRWRETPQPPPPGFPHDEDGDFTPDHTRLLGLRDQRPVDLVE